MITIDFDKADKIGNGISELNVDAKNILEVSNNIDTSGVASYSPNTVARTARIQSGLKTMSSILSTFYSTYKICINRYRSVYENSEYGIGQIKGLNGSTKGLSGGKIIGKSADGKMLKVSFGGKEFYVTNTEINCLDYENYVQESGIYQNMGVGGNQCQTLAQIYAVDMLRGSWTSAAEIEDTNGMSWSPYHRMENIKKSETSTKPIIDFTYNELKAGRPVALQVSQVNSDLGERHWVTVVGFSSNVKSANDLNADTLLVIDCVDGTIQTLSQSRSLGGHERDLYKWNGVYQVNGATSEFLESEVNS